MRLQLITAHLAPQEVSDPSTPDAEPVTMYMVVPLDADVAGSAPETTEPGSLRELMADLLDGLEECADLTVVSEFEIS